MRSIFLFLLLFEVLTVKSQDNFSERLILMGSQFEITVVAENQYTSSKLIGLAINEIKRIESLISSWDKLSQTSLINKNAGLIPVKVDLELYNLINRSIAISKLTDGAFDITFASMEGVWIFDGSMIAFPLKSKIDKFLSKVGYENIVLDDENHTVFLKKKGMRISFGGIGKGYAADKARMILVNNGVSSGIINASGDLSIWGNQASGEVWRVAITNPFNKEDVFAIVPFSEGSIVTSGNYEKFTVIDGEKYSHIINPKTGIPAQGIASVTVFSVNAELADALATAIFVMGREVGLDRVNQLPDTECVIIDIDGGVITSNNIKIDKE
jgi:thiamine biosynthesis lipoprotein